MGLKKLDQIKAVLSVGDLKLELPVVEGSEGERAVVISELRAKTGLITLDPAYMNTGACDSAITFLDGEKGILRYRGYSIEELAEHGSFEEIAYLIVNGELPKEAQLKDFKNKITSYNKTHQFIKDMIRSFPKGAHPMGILAAATVAQSSLNPSYCAQDLTTDQRQAVIPELMAQVKNMVALIYRASQSLDPVDSKGSEDYSQDFLSMMFGKEPDPQIVQALNVLLILHAEHEQNCSTSTVRMVGSSQANPYATISAGIDALWGPLHGGANQAVVEMLEEINRAGGDYKKFVERAKDKNDNFVLMGFGHRVYKNFDPRAKIIKKHCDVVLSKLGVKDPLLAIAKGLEEEALKDPYFVERKLYPNVDFYSGIMYRAMGIPTNMFTPMFALGRLPGWLSQWKEMMDNPTTKIARPRQIYTGAAPRAYVPIKKR